MENQLKILPVQISKNKKDKSKFYISAICVKKFRYYYEIVKYLSEKIIDIKKFKIKGHPLSSSTKNKIGSKFQQI